ncbi:MAG: DUF4382 domain-containing protein [Bacteroidota bacterium]
MKNRNKIWPLMAFAGLFLMSLMTPACKNDKEEDKGTGYMQMEMTDTPSNYLHVYVDIKSVEIHREDENNPGGWAVLNTRDTVYDLLTLQNNITAVLADSTLLPTGKVTQMRLILGANNSVVLNDSSSHPLTIPSSLNTGIKINLNTTIEKDRTTRVVIDYNADQSVNVLGNGSYEMKPVIQVKSIVVN